VKGEFLQANLTTPPHPVGLKQEALDRLYIKCTPAGMISIRSNCINSFLAGTTSQETTKDMIRKYLYPQWREKRVKSNSVLLTINVIVTVFKDHWMVFADCRQSGRAQLRLARLVYFCCICFIFGYN